MYVVWCERDDGSVCCWGRWLELWQAQRDAADARKRHLFRRVWIQ